MPKTTSPAKRRNQGCGESAWQARYGQRHGYFCLSDDPALPNGRRGRVTIYRRGHEIDSAAPTRFILYYCCRGKRYKERVDGDKFDAVRRADEINEALKSHPSTIKVGASSVENLVAGYTAYLRRRAEAGEISPRTPDRYGSSLQHLVRFADRRPSSRRKREQWVPDREFVLDFKAHLQGAVISPNGHPQSSCRSISPAGINYIVATVRAMIRWATQDGLLPAACAEALCQTGRDRNSSPPLSSVPIETAELIRLVQAADLYQLALFSLHIFHGVCVAEPCWLMIEFVDSTRGWIEYRCIHELGYRTKGIVNKRLPLPAPVQEAILELANGRAGGPLLIKRRFVVGSARSSGSANDLERIIHNVQQRSPANWSARSRVAAVELRKVGAIAGDDVRREFAHLVRVAGLDRSVTPKALRHHFATALEHADVPYYSRKYLLGHRMGDKDRKRGDVTAAYTHLDPNLIKSCYQRLIDGPLRGVFVAFKCRLDQIKADQQSL